MTSKKRTARRKQPAMTRRPQTPPAEVLFATLAIDISGDTPPTEFRIFKAGVNAAESDRTPEVLFDDEAAAAVMAAYEDHGVDKMVDLEHLSTDQAARNYDPDARAWCRLELRNGELWAVDVKWTVDGAERLASKKQRYVSPYFAYDKDKRVSRVVNIALTALPATHGTPELVAASLQLTTTETAAFADTEGSPMMSKELIMKAINVVKSKNSKDALALLDELIAAAIGVDPATATPAPDGEPMPDAADVAAVVADAVPDVAAASVVAEPVTEVAAAATHLARLTGKGTMSESVTEVETWRQSHLTTIADRKKLDEERKALEAGERHALVATLVKLRVEDPATAWEDHAETKPVKPVARLANEPLTDLRTRVAALSTSRGGDNPPTPPAGDGGGDLTEQQHAICKELGTDPDAFRAISAGFKR